MLPIVLAAGKRWQDYGFVFTTPTGTVLDPRNLTRTFKAVLAANNLPPIRIHDLRHSCATLLLAHRHNVAPCLTIRVPDVDANGAKAVKPRALAVRPSYAGS